MDRVSGCVSMEIVIFGRCDRYATADIHHHASKSQRSDIRARTDTGPQPTPGICTVRLTGGRCSGIMDFLRDHVQTNWYDGIQGSSIVDGIPSRRYGSIDLILQGLSINICMNLVQSLLEYHNIDPFEIIEWTLMEDSGWSVGETKAYRKGLNKHKTDNRVVTALRGLIQFVTNQPKQPRISDYPPELYVHALGPDRKLPKGTLWCHLRGQKIGLAFRVDYQERMLELLGLGTHEDMGWR